jgi:hypothetical protein
MRARTVLILSLSAVTGLSVAGCSRSTTPREEAPPATAAAPTSEPVRLAVEGRRNAYATLTSDGARVAAAWIGTGDQGSDVFAAVSDDGGAHFGAPAQVNDGAGDAAANGEQPPRILLRGSTMTVVWVAKRAGVSGIRTAESADGGRTFGPSRAISPAGVTGARGWESAAIGDDGIVHAVWLDGRHAADAAEAHAHGDMRQDIFHAMWRGTGPVIESPVADRVCFCCKTGVAARGADVFVVWRHLFPGGVRDIALARSRDGGRTFGAPVRVSDDEWKIDACPDDGPAVALAPDGAVHVVWPTLLRTDATPHMAIFESVSTDGGATFSPRRRIDTSATGASHPRLAIRGDGAVAVGWDEPDDRGSRVMVRVAGAAPRDLGAGNYPVITATTDEFVAAWTDRASPSSIHVARIR